MKKLLLILQAAISLPMFAQSNFPLMVNSNGAVMAPTNFWAGAPAVGLVASTCSPACATNRLYAFGDSSTEGCNLGGNTNYTTNSHVLPQFLWPNVVASAFGWSMGASNYGIGGTKLSAPSSNVTASIFNMMGNLEWNWSGLACVLAGWNNLDTASDNDLFWALVERAHSALLARLLIDDYSGMGSAGWDRAGNAGADGWVTTGSNNQLATAGTNSRNVSPFTLYLGGNPGTNSSRYRTSLTSNQYLQFTKNGKRSISLFYETSSDGGPFSVSVNGIPLYAGNSQWTNLGGNDSGDYPQVVWLENVPSNCTVTVAASVGGGHFFFNAYGWIDPDSTLVKKKAALYGSVVGNAYLRTENILWKMGVSARNAAGVFGSMGYPAYFANCKDAWRAQDQEPTDQGNLTPSGHLHVAAAFCTAAMAPAAREAWVIDVGRALGASRIISLNVPVNSSNAGTLGQVAWDSNFWYLCVGSNTWRRAAVSAW